MAISDSSFPLYERSQHEGLDSQPLLHPDLLYACRVPYLWEVKRILLQFVLGHKSDIGALVEVDYLSRNINDHVSSTKYF